LKEDKVKEAFLLILVYVFISLFTSTLSHSHSLLFDSQKCA
jgi:Co/Zn/Cd efflux system component